MTTQTLVKRLWSFRRFIRTITRLGAVAFAVFALSAVPAMAAEYTMTIAHLYPDDLSNNEAAPSLDGRCGRSGGSSVPSRGWGLSRSRFSPSRRCPRWPRNTP